MKVLKQAARKLFWHGTSTKYLRNILKEGLNPNPKELQYSEDWDGRDDTMSLKTYGGVYLTDNLDYADSFAQKASRQQGGDRLYVAVSYETRTQTALLDEDYFLSSVSFAARTRKGSHLFDVSQGSPWAYIFYMSNLKDADYLKPSGYLLAHSLIDGTPDRDENMQKMLNSFFSHVVEGNPKLALVVNKRRDLLEGVVSELLRAYAKHLLEALYQSQKEKLIKKYSNEQSPFFDYYEASVLEKDLNVLGGSYSNLVKLTNLATKAMKEVTSEKNKITQNHNIRVQEPIKFSGKNRILALFTAQREADGSHTVKALYVKDPSLLENFVMEYHKMSGGTAQFLNKTGKPLFYTISNSFYQGREGVPENWSITREELLKKQKGFIVKV